MVYDNDALDHLHDELLKLIETLKHRAPNDQRLVLEKPNAVRNMKPKIKKIKFNGYSRNFGRAEKKS